MGLHQPSEERQHHGDRGKDPRMRVLVTGGCGYIGSVLVPKLERAGHVVSIADLMWFWEHQSAASDFREYTDLSGFDAVIHLAAIANDPTGDLDPKLTWETNALGTMQLAATAALDGVKQFIYASSGSVYGVSDQSQVTEETTLNPLSEYNKTKMVAERCVLSYANPMSVQIVRPGTVCGYSPRLRLDVVVNRFVAQAVTKSRIEVLGGKQMRPNIHIDDMANLYVWMLEHPQLTGIWNASFENLTVMEIARKVQECVGCAIVEEPSNDPRSYRMNSDKLLSAGFKPNRTVDGAIIELCAAYLQGVWRDEDINYNLKVMKSLGLQRAA
jgi:nucleoside-diphosphate-sugar epimerase